MVFKSVAKAFLSLSGTYFSVKVFDRGLITLDKRYKIIVSRKLKDTEIDSETKSWFMGYSDHQIILPDKFLPGKDFIEYHNDVIFQR